MLSLFIDQRNYPDTLLLVKCGYKYRFFGEDAVNAAKVLSISARMVNKHYEDICHIKSTVFTES